MSRPGPDLTDATRDLASSLDATLKCRLLYPARRWAYARQARSLIAALRLLRGYAQAHPPAPPHIYLATVEARRYDRDTGGRGELETLTAMGESPRAARDELARRCVHHVNADPELYDYPVSTGWADVIPIVFGDCDECGRTYRASHLAMHPMGDGELLCVQCAAECADATPALYPCLRTTCALCRAPASTLDTERQQGLCGGCWDDAHQDTHQGAERLQENVG